MEWLEITANSNGSQHLTDIRLDGWNCFLVFILNKIVYSGNSSSENLSIFFIPDVYAFPVYVLANCPCISSCFLASFWVHAHPTEAFHLEEEGPAVYYPLIIERRWKTLFAHVVHQVQRRSHLNQLSNLQHVEAKNLFFGCDGGHFIGMISISQVTKQHASMQVFQPWFN